MSNLAGEISKKIRGLKKWSQAQLAERLSISRNYVALIEGGAKTPSVRLLNQLEQVLAIVENESSAGEGPVGLRGGDKGSVLARLREEIDADLRHLVAQAADDPGRLGWLREEIRGIRSRVHWKISVDEIAAAERMIEDLKREAAHRGSLIPARKERHA